MAKKMKRKIAQCLLTVAPLFSKKSQLDGEAAKNTLAAYSPKPNGTPIRPNRLREPLCDLQIIVPAYNVEAYLEGCLESILSQETGYTYKVVVIDDGSTDKTGEIADQYADHHRVVVIHQANKGFSGARNTGLEDLFAKYIMFVDSDDRLCPGAIEALMGTATKYGSDVVEGGALSLTGEKTEPYFAHPREQEIPTALGVFHGQPWAKVFKADCFAHLIYPEGYWFEDTVFSFLVYPIKDKVAVSDRPVYVYRLNEKGISATHKKKSKSVDTYWITELLMDVRRGLGQSFDQPFLEKYLRQVVLNQKRMAQLPPHIQESAFVLSAEMMRQYFPAELIQANRHKTLVKILRRNDWGAYRFYCRYYH